VHHFLCFTEDVIPEEQEDLAGSPVVGSEGTSPAQLARQYSR